MLSPVFGSCGLTALLLDTMVAIIRAVPNEHKKMSGIVTKTWHIYSRKNVVFVRKPDFESFWHLFSIKLTSGFLNKNTCFSFLETWQFRYSKISGINRDIYVVRICDFFLPSLGTTLRLETGVYFFQEGRAYFWRRNTTVPGTDSTYSIHVPKSGY